MKKYVTFLLLLALLIFLLNNNINNFNKNISYNNTNEVSGKEAILKNNKNQQKEIKIITNEDDYHLNGILREFERTTGIKTSLSFTEDSLLSRLNNREEGQIVFSKISSELIEANNKNPNLFININNIYDIPEKYKDKNSKWFNLSYRIRGFYIKKNISDYPKTYEELSDSKYKGKICIRPLTHTYNIQLIAYMIAKHGEEYTRNWLKGLKNNLAIQPSGADRDQIKNIFEGKCEIAVANSYYMGLMLSNAKQREWANAVNLFFPNQQETEPGALALYNGIALTKERLGDKNVEKIIEFMKSPLGQQYLASSNYEYPISENIESEMINSFGRFQNLKPSQIKIDNNISQEMVAKEREKALLLVKELY